MFERKFELESISRELAMELEIDLPIQLARVAALVELMPSTIASVAPVIPDVEPITMP